MMKTLNVLSEKIIIIVVWGMKTLILLYIMKVNPMKIIISIFTHTLDYDCNDDDHYISYQGKKQR
jgi:hypothetical protein